MRGCVCGCRCESGSGSAAASAVLSLHVAWLSGLVWVPTRCVGMRWGLGGGAGGGLETVAHVEVQVTCKQAVGVSDISETVAHVEVQVTCKQTVVGEQ